MATATDLSTGSVLVARSTGWRYTIRAVDALANQVTLTGPHGTLTVPWSELQRDVARGKIEVRG